MPLVRGPDGSLGVAGGGGAVTVNFNVTSPDARSFAASEAECGMLLGRCAAGRGKLIARRAAASGSGGSRCARGLPPPASLRSAPSP